MRKQTKMKAVLVTGVLAANLGLAVGPAAAHHTHAIEFQNGAHEGSCVVLARNGNEKDIVNPRWEDTRGSHPLHMNVHAGAPVDKGGLVIHARDNVADLAGETGPCAELVNVP